MSEEIRCTLTDEELIAKSREVLTDLCRAGGKNFIMRIPVDYNNDSDMILSELIRRFEKTI